MGDNVYILYDYNNALIVDGYWIATVDEDGNMNRKWESPWKKLECPVSDISSSGPVMENDVKPEINLDVDMTLVDSLLESAYNDILSDLMYKE